METAILKNRHLCALSPQLKDSKIKIVLKKKPSYVIKEGFKYYYLFLVSCHG